MQIRTPKKYRGSMRRQPFSCGRYLVWFILLGFIFAGVGVYQNRQVIEPIVNRLAGTAMSDINNRAATAAAPLPTATSDPALNLINGDNAWLRGDVGNALLAYEQIIGSVPNNVAVYERVTMASLSRGALDKGLRYAHNTVTADPFDSDAWASHAFVLAWEDQYQAAIASAYQALDINPENARAMAFLAYAYWSSEQYELARSRANEAIRMNPERFEGYWVRGLISENTDFDFAAALTDYQTAYDYALEQNPAMAGIAAAGIARILITGLYDDVAGAISILEASRALDPDNTTVLYWLGRIQFQYRGDYAQAQSPLDDCIRVNPEDYNCLYYLGRSLDKLGDQAGALEAFIAAIEAGSPAARTYWWAANMHIALGSCSEATFYIETGYRMVAPGDLPAVDEGVEELEGAYQALLSTCRIAIGSSSSSSSSESDTDTDTEDNP